MFENVVLERVEFEKNLLFEEIRYCSDLQAMRKTLFSFLNFLKCPFKAKKTAESNSMISR